MHVICDHVAYMCMLHAAFQLLGYVRSIGYIGMQIHGHTRTHMHAHRIDKWVDGLLVSIMPAQVTSSCQDQIATDAGMPT